MAHLYLASHVGSVAVPDTTNHQYKRCPSGDSSIWLECGDDVGVEVALEKVAEELEEESRVLIAGVDIEFTDVCKKKGWTVADSGEGDFYYGYEAEVSVKL